jgi:hypothetical protein
MGIGKSIGHNLVFSFCHPGKYSLLELKPLGGFTSKMNTHRWDGCTVLGILGCYARLKNITLNKQTLIILTEDSKTLTVYAVLCQK